MKEHKFLKPQTLFVVTAFLVSLANFLFFKSDITIQLYDTYYVISQKFVAQLLSMICIACFTIYYIADKFIWPLQNRLGYIHYVLTVIPLLILVLKPSADISMMSLLAIVATVLLLAGQVALILNIVRSGREYVEDRKQNLN